MAEIKTGIFAKNVQKRLNRAQEKVLQKLGKADETKDEQFEQVVINFKRQESEGSRLQREMKAYMSAIKGMQQASINLTQSLHEVYEPDWHGKDDVLTIGKDCDALWEDFHNKLVDSTLLNLDEYLQQFPDLKTRVAKRSRKLIDYDSARHHVETLQASGIKSDRKIIKAEEELKKAQRVFDELNVGLQDELPTLWDCRVGFYISTFKSVTSLEAKFHREISLVCKELYEVMTKLAEQHSDKMFTIQGAPSDSGPLRLARTPSPPEDESPPESPDASSNHMLRPVSPGPPRPKSPTQLKKGPPVPPPPKVTPTKEVAEEQIIDLFGGEFLPAPSPSQPNERPGQSLLDLDFDDFQPDESVSPIPQTAVPWDMWSANSQPAQPGAEAGFVADWSADFGSVPANGDASTAKPPGAPEPPAAGLEGDQGGTQGWPQAEGLQPGEDTTTTQDSESTAAEDEVAGEFNGFSQDAAAPSFFADFDNMNKVSHESNESPEAPEAQIPGPTEIAELQNKPQEPSTGGEEHESQSAPAGEDSLIPPMEKEMEEPPFIPVDEDSLISPVEKEMEEALSLSAGEVKEPEDPPADEEEVKSSESLKEENAPALVGSQDSERAELGEIPHPEETKTSLTENMPIPSVVIEPASSNEGDDDRDGDIISPTTISDNGVATESQSIKHMTPSGGVSGLPVDFLYKVETMHDFEAANSDELELKRGDVVLVVPTASVEDQDAGWLTGMKESDWLTLGISAQRGLFPENFTQRLE
ncbi:amphiphysin isoform X2 [Melanotaenia boesemani]|uniref:amphiphysin isoform X2 n=1 Tax=Melanotaenia boesemani TaxID=1250792 RepID=UPI001C043C69|nr:amphiphysin isoform X2 [Melanotaenia boesemani]